MANPTILYDNRLDDGTPQEDSFESGFDVENIRDLRDYTYWKAADGSTPVRILVDCGESKSADTLGIIGHNLGTIAADISVKNAPSDPDSSSGVSENEVLASFTPSNDFAILKPFTASSDQWWWLNLDTSESDGLFSTAPYIAGLFIGTRLTFPNPPRSPAVLRSETVKLETTRSKEGRHLGSIINFTQVNIRLSIPVPSKTWFESNFLPFWNNHASQMKPFLFAWDLDTYPNLIYWAKMVDKYNFRQAMTVPDSVDRIDLTMEAIKEE